MPGEPPRKGCWDWTSALNNYGYGQFSIIINGKPDLVLAHRVSYRIYHGEIPEGLSVLHVCDRPICCQPAHLWLGTRGDNIRDAAAKGRHQHGERHVNAKLTEAQVNWIRQSTLSHVEVAKMVGIGRRTVADIRNGKTWKSLL